MIPFLAKVLVVMIMKCGIKILLTLIIAHVAVMTMKYLYKALRKIVNAIVKKVFVGGADKIIQAISKEKQSVNLDELKEGLGEEGVIIAEIDQDDNVDEDSIKIIKADSMEKSLKNKLNNNEGILLSA